MPSVNRARPLRPSMPMKPSVNPSSRLNHPSSLESPSIVVTITNASTISAKYSGDPNASASFTINGAVTLSASVASVPATNDPIADVARMLAHAMNVPQLKRFCHAMPGATEKHYAEPWNFLVYSVGGRKFAYFKTSEPERWRFSIRVTPERFVELTDV